MKTYYGNYLGLVVDDRDPQQRGRVKVFIPHIMPALYENWNKEGKDIQFNIIGTFDSENLQGAPEGLSIEVIQRLQKILPWAECAAPVFGAGPAAIFNYETGEMSPGALNGGNFNFGQYEQGVVGQGGKVVYDAEGDALEIDPSLVRPGNTLGTVKEILLHDTGGTGIGFLEAREGGTYNYIVYNGRVYNTTPEGTASTYGALNRNSNSIHIAWVGPFGGTPNATDLNLLRQTISYVANRYGLNKSDIKTHGAVQENKKGDAEGWAPIVLGSIVTDGKEKDKNASWDTEAPMADADTKPNVVDETGEIQDTGTLRSREVTKYNEENGTSYKLGEDGITIVDSNNEVVGTTYTTNDGKEVEVSITDDPDTILQPLPELEEDANQTLSGPQIDQDLPPVSTQTGGSSSSSISIDASAPGTTVAGGGTQASSNPTVSISAPTGEATDTEEITAADSQGQIPSPTEHGTTFVNTNYQPTGMFGSARAGQMVWVFFQEGNPLFPVYFAASYGKNEWGNVNQHKSANKPKLVKTEDNDEQDALQGSQTTLSLNAGGIKDTQWISEQASGFEKDEFAFQVYGKNGSNLTFTYHATLLNSKYDFRQHTQGDAHYITGVNRTDRTVGDHVTVVEQDVICTIGNWSKEALEAANNVQEVIDRAMKAAKDTYEA